MDAGDHLTRPLLLSFLEATAAPEERRRVVRHLLTKCEPCRDLAEKVWLETGGLRLVPRSSGEASDLRFSLPHLAAVEARKRREDAAAPALWEQIRDLPPGRRSLLLRTPELEAFMKLQQHEPLYQQFPDAFTQLQLRVVQARIAGKLDLFDEAREIYLDIEQGLEEIEEYQGMVLAKIELVELLMARGMKEPALEIARAVTPVLESLGLRNDLLAVWSFLADALEEDLLLAEVFRHTTEYFVR